MAKDSFNEDFSFYRTLWAFYDQNRGKIRSRYKPLTKKFLSYNDSVDNASAFLRKPQFEALEMYVFIKEFLNNQQIYEIFDDWRHHKNRFDDASYYSVNKDGQYKVFDILTDKQTDTIFKQMKKYKEDYPNYIFALTMGLGKTILMATCIFYEFLLANKYPKDPRYCHNALVFAPDKTVLESLREIMTFDKTKVVPPEHASVLDANIKFHYLEDSGMSLGTIDDSDFNIIISNTQKIIVKKKRKETSAVESLFAGGSDLISSIFKGFGDEDDDDLEAWDDVTLRDNQRFKRLIRLPQLGVYVDEAHHLFGSALEKSLRAGNPEKTSLRNTINLLNKSTSLVSCYNFTGTPYVKNQVLPEVVYSYGLRDSINNGYLKDANPIALENVKGEEFLRAVVKDFWGKYGEKTYEDLTPKLAIFASNVAEIEDEIRPNLERVLSELNIDTSKILVNVGNEKLTKSTDIKLFNDLDVAGSEGNEKQFILLCGKGTEGWNCRSLFGVAMHRNPKSKVFVLQATMRCLRSITDEKQKATVYLSKDNYDTLDAELKKNFNMEIRDLSSSTSDGKKVYKVKVVPPKRTFKLKRTWREYELKEKTQREPVFFDLSDEVLDKYKAKVYERGSIAKDTTLKEHSADHLLSGVTYSLFTLVAEIARYMNESPLKIEKILKGFENGALDVLEKVNLYNDVLYDIVVPSIFNNLYDIVETVKSEDRDVVLLKEPADAGYYEFKGKPELVFERDDEQFTQEERDKSFHASVYCFDSKPEKECFTQYISSLDVDEVYFTGMFTAEQGDLYVNYYDPDAQRIRQYYPDFFAKMSDGTYRLIEVKGDNKIDDRIVQAKKEAALEMASASGVEYIMYAGSTIMSTNVLGGGSMLSEEQKML